MDKVHSALTFEQKLNLKKYVDSFLYKGNANYTCRAVIVHSGNTDNGHYYTFIKDKDEQWFQFNDSIVEQRMNMKCMTTITEGKCTVTRTLRRKAELRGL